MKTMQDAVRESVQDFFQQFAYLDLSVRAGADLPELDWTLCARVECDGGGDAVTVFINPKLAQAVAEGFSGSEACEVAEMKDLVLEVANILAGQVYEISHGGRKPEQIGQPAWLAANDAGALWVDAEPDQRHALYLDEQLLGGLVLSFQEAWSGKWE